MSVGYTVGELRQRLEAMRPELPVVVQVTEPDGGYMKAYATSVTHVHDCLPDGEGGDDIDNAGFILLIEAQLER